MIIEWLLDAIEALIRWLAGLFPTWNPDALDGFSSVLSHVGDLNYFLPIAEVFGVVVGAFMLFPALMGVSLAVWLVALIRGGSARG